MKNVFDADDINFSKDNFSTPPPRHRPQQHASPFRTDAAHDYEWATGTEVPFQRAQPARRPETKIPSRKFNVVPPDNSASTLSSIFSEMEVTSCGSRPRSATDRKPSAAATRPPARPPTSTTRSSSRRSSSSRFNHQHGGVPVPAARAPAATLDDAEMKGIRMVRKTSRNNARSGKKNAGQSGCRCRLQV